MKRIIQKMNWLGWAQAITVFVFILASAVFSHAGTAFGSELPVPGKLKSTPGLNTNDYSLNDLIIRVITWMLAIALAVDVLFLIIGGFMYITSAGNEDRAKSGRKTVLNAIIGLVVIILAYVIAKVVSNFFATENLN